MALSHFMTVGRDTKWVPTEGDTGRVYIKANWLCGPFGEAVEAKAALRDSFLVHSRPTAPAAQSRHEQCLAGRARAM